MVHESNNTHLAFFFSSPTLPHLRPHSLRRPRPCACPSRLVCHGDPKRPKRPDLPDVPEDRDQDNSSSWLSRLRQWPRAADHKEKPAEPFRWPWRKCVRNDSAPRAHHSDSKPGAFGRTSDAKKSKKNDEKSTLDTSDEVLSWQERWRGVMRVITPGFAKDANSSKDLADNPEIPEIPDVEDDAEANGTGIKEIYKPPPDRDHPSKGTTPFQRLWFRFPWIREVQQKGIEVDKNCEGNVKKNGNVVNEESVKHSESYAKPERLKKPEDPVKVVVSKPEPEQVDNGEIEPSDNMEPEAKKPKPAVILRGTQLTPPKAVPVDIVSIPQRDVATIRLIFGSETFFATETLSAPGGLIFRGNLRGEPKATLAKLEARLAARLGDKYTLCLAEGEEDLRPVVVVVPTARDKRPATPRHRFMAVAVALMTISTCLGRGLHAIVMKPAMHALHGPPPREALLHRFFGRPSMTSVTIAVAIGLVIIISQIVQRIVASRHGTRIAIPLVLPSYQLGSFGAIVQLASPTPSRAALFDIALSGAATLVLLSVTCLLIGLRMSTSFSWVLPVPMSMVSNSVVIGFLAQQVPNGQILVDYGRSLIGLHPLAVIGANCLTISALNLLPIRQLDGGRIISALYGRKTAVLASRVTVLFLLLASSKSPYFVVFLAAVAFGPWSLDRPAKNELTEPNALRTILGYLFMLLMIGILLPFPACKFFGTLK